MELCQGLIHLRVQSEDQHRSTREKKCAAYLASLADNVKFAVLAQLRDAPGSQGRVAWCGGKRAGWFCPSLSERTRQPREDDGHEVVCDEQRQGMSECTWYMYTTDLFCQGVEMPWSQDPGDERTAHVGFV